MSTAPTSESDWKPASWAASYRFLFVRRRVRRQTKEALQLDLFEPRAFDHEYRVLVSNKPGSAHSVLLFHYGRGAQEAIFAEAKQHAGLDLIPTRRLYANQMVTLCAMMAHNLGREMPDAGAGAIELFARQTSAGVDLPEPGHPASALAASRRASHSAPRGVDPDNELEPESRKRSVAFPRNAEGGGLITTTRFKQIYATLG